VIRQSLGQALAIEMGISAGTGEAPHVSHQLNTVSTKKGDKALQCSIGMSNGQTGRPLTCHIDNLAHFSLAAKVEV
jgi:hypothetical protein